MFSSLALVSSFVAIPALAAVTPRQSTDVNYWFSFGDSYSQTWFDPNGTLPSIGNPLGNPEYPGWTATGGENWVDYVTTTYNKSLILTYNYAYGGATINASLVEPYEPTVLSLIDQVQEYLDGAAKKPETSPWTSQNSLFSIWIGINDIGNSWWLSDRDAFSDVLLDSEFGQVEHDTGARNFLFVSVPPTDRSPYAILNADESARNTWDSVIQGFNTKLQARAEDFASSHDGVTTFWWDAYAQFDTILNDLADYGFTTNETAYGTDPSNFWGNDYHPSSYANKYFGEEVGENVLSDTIW